MKNEKKVTAKELKKGDNLIYKKDGSRYGLQSIIQLVVQDGSIIKVKIIDGWLQFNLDDAVSLQLADPFDRQVLQNRSSKPKTFQLGKRKISIE